MLQGSASLALLASVAAAQKVYQGFNSGAFFTDYKAKEQSDFEDEFNAAQALENSPGLFNSVRLYTMIQHDTTDEPSQAFPAAIATNTSMLLGIWCSGTDNIDNELSALAAAIDEHGSAFTDLVVGISVGSEDLYRISESGIENEAGIGNGPEEIIDFIQQLRDAIEDTPLAEVPVGHVDTWSVWSNESNADVVDAVDFVGVDLYPYFEKDKGNAFDNVTNVFNYIFDEAKAGAGDKPIWITETGYPVDGPNFGDAEASVENAMMYWQMFGCPTFGKTNVWWYNLRDSNPENDATFSITDELSATPRFNLTCPPDSGAPATINVKMGASSRVAPATQVLVGLFAVLSLFCTL